MVGFRSPTTVCCIATFCFLVCAFAVPLLDFLQNLGRLIFGRSLSVLCLLLVDPCSSSHCACLRVRALHLQFNHLTTFCRLFPSGYVIWGWSGRHVPPAALLFLLTANALQASSDSCSHQEITSRRWLRGYFSLFSLSRIVGRRECEQSLCVFACAHPCICNITT